MSITGQGAASKEQVASMLMNILKFNLTEIKLDATDGLAAALCHFYQTNNPTQEKSYNSWKDFMNKNPKRVKKTGNKPVIPRQMPSANTYLYSFKS
jgi:crossover junction endodeoxyribonuclease RuvC